MAQSSSESKANKVSESLGCVDGYASATTTKPSTKVDNSRVNDCKLWVESAPLFAPPLALLAKRIEAALKNCFEEVSVQLVECPDLSALYGVAAPGLSGSTRLVEVGGVPNMHEPDYHHTYFSLANVARQVNLPNGYFLGAGATCPRVLGHNGELMPCSDLGRGANRSTFADVLTDGSYRLGDYQHHEFACLANFFGSEGKSGPVIKIKAKRGKGNDSISRKIRESLAVDMEKGVFDTADFKQKFPALQPHIGLGGVLFLKTGSIKAHVMPDFASQVLEEGPMVEKWLRFYPMGPELVLLSTFLTGDPSGGSMNVRNEHTHFYNRSSGQGGHYHNHTAPETVEYEGYLNLAETYYRVENAFRRNKCLCSKL